MADTTAAENCIVDAGTPVEEAVQLIERHGTVLCRGAFEPLHVWQFAENAERFFGYVEYCLLNKIEIPQLRPYNVTTLRMAANMLALNPRPQPIQLAILNLMQGSYVYPIIQSYLKTQKALFLFHKSRVRKVYPESHPLSQAVKSRFPYHQDAHGVSQTTESLHCWLPLDGCGAISPGIEVALKRIKDLLPMKNDPSSVYKDFELVEKDVERAIEGVPTMAADYALGDLQLIPSATLHRSTSNEGMFRPSIAAELRFAAESAVSAFPEEKQPILV